MKVVSDGLRKRLPTLSELWLYVKKASMGGTALQAHRRATLKPITYEIVALCSTRRWMTISLDWCHLSNQQGSTCLVMEVLFYHHLDLLAIMSCLPACCT